MDRILKVFLKGINKDHRSSKQKTRFFQVGGIGVAFFGKKIPILEGGGCLGAGHNGPKSGFNFFCAVARKGVKKGSKYFFRADARPKPYKKSLKDFIRADARPES